MQHLGPLVDNRFAQQHRELPPVGVPIRVSLRFKATDLVVADGGRLRLTLSGTVIRSMGSTESKKGSP